MGNIRKAQRVLWGSLFLFLLLVGCTAGQRAVRSARDFLQAWDERDGEKLEAAAQAQLVQHIMGVDGDRFLEMSGLVPGGVQDIRTIQHDEDRIVLELHVPETGEPFTRVLLVVRMEADGEWRVSGIRYIPPAGPVPAPDDLVTLAAETLDSLLALHEAAEPVPALNRLPAEELAQAGTVLAQVPELFRTEGDAALTLDAEPALEENFLVVSGNRKTGPFHLRFHFRYQWGGGKWFPVSVRLRVE